MTDCVSTTRVRSRTAPSTIMFMILVFFIFTASSLAGIPSTLISVRVGGVMMLVES